jgi:hypothetical protein
MQSSTFVEKAKTSKYSAGWIKAFEGYEPT